jgi:hypothetical protein
LRTRKNIGGKNVSVNYGRLTSIALDPMQKSRWPGFTRQPHFVRGQLRLQHGLSFLPNLFDIDP